VIGRLIQALFPKIDYGSLDLDRFKLSFDIYKIVIFPGVGWDRCCVVLVVEGYGQDEKILRKKSN
jgi:hypothetical protein